MSSAASPPATAATESNGGAAPVTNASDAMSTAPTILAPAAVLAGFKLTQILSQDAKTKSAILLGHFPAPAGKAGHETEQAIILIEKTHFPDDFFASIGEEQQPATAFNGRATEAELRHFSALVSLGNNDIYSWLLGFLRPARPGHGSADVKFSMIRPATATHIAKYSEQEKVMIHENAELYKTVTLPWIESQDPSRIAWVGNLIEGRKERENVVFRDEDPATGFVILPDLKWDKLTLPSLYLIAIARDPDLRTIRDLRREHIPLLRKIVAAAEQVAASRYGLVSPVEHASGSQAATALHGAATPGAPAVGGKLRCFIHYPPSYYHLHVHVLSADYTSHAGAICGQAHLVDDLIDLLELGVDFTQRTLTYHVGVRSDIYTKVFEPHSQQERQQR